MSPLTIRSRSVRAGAAFAGAAGALLLAGCGASAPATTTPDAGASADGSGDAAGAASGAYTDGTYTADGSYLTPESVEQITVTVTLESDVITAVEVTGDPQTANTEQYQSAFIGGISTEVVGVDIDEISVSRVAGSSLTSQGFNEAIDAIKAEAAS